MSGAVPSEKSGSLRISRVPLLIGIAIGGLGTSAVALVVMTKSADPAAATPASASGSAAQSAEVVAQAPSSNVAPGPSASLSGASSPVPSGVPLDKGSVAGMFGADSPADGEPGSIYKGGKASGVIVLLPTEFKNRLALGGEGFTTSISSSGGVAASKLSFKVTRRISTATELTDLNQGALMHACGKTLLAAPSWDAGENVSWEAGAKRGRVWKAKGTYGGGERERFAYVLATIVGEYEVVGCGAWNADTPELEQRVVAVLKSVRLGEGPRTDVSGL